MKKRLLVAAVATIVMISMMASTAFAMEVGETKGSEEIILTLDENGNAGVSVGFIVYSDHTDYFDMSIPDQKDAFYNAQTSMASSNSIMPLAEVGMIHVGIEMSGSKYKMYYDVTGTALKSARGYMKCKSTALLFATTYLDEYFLNTSALGTTKLSGESALFSLPDGTEKVKVGWHDVTILDVDGGSATPSDTYASVKVG